MALRRRLSTVLPFRGRKAFRSRQQEAFRGERERWRVNGLLEVSAPEEMPELDQADGQVAEGCELVKSPMTASVFQVAVEAGQPVVAGTKLVVLDAMKTEIVIAAPTAGVVHQLATHTIGGVIRAGDAIMEVVPDSDDLQIEAKLQPNDIDQVRKGQQAFVRFSAFNQRVTPQLIGQVSFVSPDTTRDQQTNTSYFTVRIMLPEEERRRLAGLQLVSGMPAEVFMQTGSRTMLSYLFKPILDQFQRAFVER